MSTLNKLPAPDALKTKSKALAILDAIYCQDWDMRYFSHNAHWADDQEMSSMRDGQGDDYFVIHAPYGTAIKGCASENEILGDSAFLDLVRQQVPARFAEFLSEPAFSMDEASFVLWFDGDSATWQAAGSPSSQNDGGQADLLQWLCEGPAFYQSWAQTYYETDIDLALVEKAFSQEPISLGLIESLGIPFDRDTLIEDFEEIGYPYTA